MATTKTKKRKVASAVTAVVLAVAIALTGTFAWQSISQTALNETTGEVKPGGRLHDDFDGRNKDVYVENFTDANEGGVAIYARVRLDEYMEIGAGAGLKIGDADYDSKEATPLIAGADINDVSTWKTHIPDDDTDVFHNDYWNWTLGGQTIYMPTFNKNKDSLATDINGTYEGTDASDDIHYDDYVPYAAGESKTDNAIYDADDNEVDEGDAAVEGTNITTVEETHVATSTINGSVMTMAEWKAAGSKPGAYWVYDVDGWAYWAQAIEPGTATGLLLDGISLQKEPGDNWYYAVNVVGQFATMGDWGAEADGTGFYGSDAGAAPTADALFLLNQAAGRELTVKVTASTNEVKLGESATFTAAVSAGEAVHPNQKVSWSVTGNQSKSTTINADGKLTVGADEIVGSTLTVRALSTVDNTTVGTYDITVLSSWDETGIGNMEVGTLQSVTIDGADWYLLARDGNNALLLSKDILEQRQFDASAPQWATSAMRTYLNGEWLEGQATLSAHAAEVTLNTRSTYDGGEEDFTETQDKVFLLSEADVFGTQNGVTAVAKDYTLGVEGVIMPANMRVATLNGTAAWYWLRSPRRDLSSLATVLNDKPGTGAVYWSTTGGVRPALPEAAKSCVARVGEHRLCITAPPLGIGSARRT